MTGITITGAGPVNASEEGGHRRYTWQGRQLVSVTSWPRMAGMEENLFRWKVWNLIDHVIASADDIGLRVAANDERELKVLKAQLWRAIEGQDTARLSGIAVHHAAATGKRPEDAHPQVAPKLRQYLDWLAQSRAEIVGSEFQVWNLTEGYAGTVDLLVRFPNGEVWLVDLKTGKGLYAVHALQLVAYLMSEFVGRDDVVDPVMSEAMSQVSGVGILHLGDADWEFVSLKPEVIAKVWTAYRGAIRYADLLTTHQNLDGLVGVRRWSDGRTTDLLAVAAAQDGAQVDVYGKLGWVWAQIGANLAHLVPPQGDAALCMRPVERGRRTELEAEPERVCARCKAHREEAGRAA